MEPIIETLKEDIIVDKQELNPIIKNDSASSFV